MDVLVAKAGTGLSGIGTSGSIVLPPGTVPSAGTAPVGTSSSNNNNNNNAATSAASVAAMAGYTVNVGAFADSGPGRVNNGKGGRGVGASATAVGDEPLQHFPSLFSHQPQLAYSRQDVVGRINKSIAGMRSTLHVYVLVVVALLWPWRGIARPSGARVQGELTFQVACGVWRRGGCCAGWSKSGTTIR